MAYMWQSWWFDIVTAASEQLDSMEPHYTRPTSILGSLHGHFVENSLDSNTWIVHFATVHFIAYAG